MRTVAKLHAKGIIHRDLKPSNILVDRAIGTPVLTDFGLAKLMDAPMGITLSDEGLGCPPYMAPEQVLHAARVTAAADIYSLGATFYHLLTGRPPFQSESLPDIARQIVFCDPPPPRQLNRSIDLDAETICLKCLEKDEQRRYASADELADDLQRLIERRPIRARPIGRLGRLRKWSQRNPAWVVLAVANHPDQRFGRRRRGEFVCTKVAAAVTKLRLGRNARPPVGRVFHAFAVRSGRRSASIAAVVGGLLGARRRDATRNDDPRADRVRDQSWPGTESHVLPPAPHTLGKLQPRGRSGDHRRLG